MMIEVCGPGCPRCHATKENIRKVLKEMKLKEGEEVAVMEIKDPRMISARGVFITPAVVIDAVKVCEGRIPSADEIRQWIEERR
jgi:small redox-active disulfide protein 2